MAAAAKSTRLTQQENETVEGGLADVDQILTHVERCLAGISSTDLEKTISLFEEAVANAAFASTLWMDSLVGLAISLGLKFVRSRGNEGLQEYLEVESKMREVSTDFTLDPKFLDIGEKGGTRLRNSIESAQKTLSEIRESIAPSLSSMSLSMPFLHHSLVTLPASHPKRIRVVQTLVNISCLRFASQLDSTAEMNFATLIIRHNLQAFDENGQRELQRHLQFLQASVSIAQMHGSRMEDKSGSYSPASVEMRPLADESTRTLAHQAEPQNEVADINTAIDSVPTGLTAEDFALRLSNEAKALLQQFNQDGNIDVLQRSISLSKQALQMIPASHPEYFVMLYELGSGIQALYHQQGVHENLDKAITLYKQAAKLAPARHPLWIGSLDKLASAFYAHFQCTSDPQNIRDAILLSKQAIELRGHADPDLCVSLNRLATGLLTHFEQEADPQILLEAISISMQALRLTPPSHPHRAESLSNASAGLYLRFKEAENPQDIEIAISLSRQALQLRPARHPERFFTLDKLGNQLLARFQHQGKDPDLSEAMSLQSQALELTPPSHPAHHICLNNFANTLLIGSETSGNLRGVEEAISLYKQVLQSTTLPKLERIAPSINLGNALTTRSSQQGSVLDLEEAISLYKSALELSPISHPTRPSVFSMASRLLLQIFELKGEICHLDEAISFSKQALELTTPSHRDRVRNLRTLSRGLLRRFEQRGDPRELDESIVINRHILKLESEPDSGRVRSLISLSQSLLMRSYQQGHARDLDESIILSKEAVLLSPEPDSDRAESLNNLANTLLVRFEQRGNVQDLNNSIALCKQAVELEQQPTSVQESTDYASAPPKRSQDPGSVNDIDDTVSLFRQALERMPIGHPSRPSFLNNLAISLQERFEQRGEVQDLDDAITLYTQALESTPKSQSDYVELLINLATELHSRYEQRKDVDDLINAVLRYKDAIDMLPPSHPARPSTLINLATALLAQFSSKGDEQDLNDAIAASKKALTFEHLSHTESASLANTHANALLARFEQSGDVRDLDEAVASHRSALQRRSPSDPIQSNWLHNFATVLFARFNERGDDKDINEAISLQRQALEFSPPSDSGDLSTLRSLTMILMTRFQRQNNVQDLDEAISLHRGALEILPAGDPSRMIFVMDLSNALSTRFSRQGAFKDIEEAITLCRQAAELVPPSHTFYAGLHFNFAAMLSARFREQGSVSDFNEALATFKKTLTLLPANDPRIPSALCNFAKLHIVAHEKLGQQGSIDLAISLFSKATQSAVQSPALRWSCAVQWAQYANKHQHPSALEAFEVALSMLPELAAVGFEVLWHQGATIEGTRELARHAAKCAISAENLGKAVEFLEAGRSVFWSLSLNLKTPFDQLHDVAPQLADELRQIAMKLEQASHKQSTPSGLLPNTQIVLLEGETRTSERLAAEWAEKVGQVRGLEGFEDFLRPKSLSKLQSAAARRPVVYLIANDSSSDCLILTSSHIYHIPLPTLPAAVVSELVRLVRTAVSESPVVVGTPANEVDQQGMKLESDVERHESSDDLFRSVLGTLWSELVQPVIQVLGLKGSGTKTALAWCATGLFSFLPIHAAGRYIDGGVECASQYLISSYTPTLGALLTPNHPPVTPFRMMTIVHSQSLPNAMEEMRGIKQRVNNDSLIKFGSRESPASVETVASHLPQASIVHFACQGKQDVGSPLQSGIVMENGMLTIGRIMEKALPAGSLAFLSGCETAVGDGTIPDEAMTVGASLLFAGFQRVVAAMWRTWDQDIPVVVNAFYRELFRGTDGNPMIVPDASKSAEAMSIAVEELRSQGVEFRRWVPIIHIGK